MCHNDRISLSDSLAFRCLGYSRRRPSFVRRKLCFHSPELTQLAGQPWDGVVRNVQIVQTRQLAQTARRNEEANKRESLHVKVENSCIIQLFNLLQKQKQKQKNLSMTMEWLCIMLCLPASNTDTPVLALVILGILHMFFGKESPSIGVIWARAFWCQNIGAMLLIRMSKAQAGKRKKKLCSLCLLPS